jgi:hypothetical protein
MNVFEEPGFDFDTPMGPLNPIDHGLDPAFDPSIPAEILPMDWGYWNSLFREYDLQASEGNQYSEY